MKLISRLISVILAVLLSANAYAGAIIGATEPTQILNNIQLLMSYVEQAQQTITQFNQYQTMLKNLQQMTPSSMLDAQAHKLWQDQNMTQAFRNLQKIYIAGQQASYSFANADSKFKQMHPGYGVGGNFSGKYRDWSDNTLGSVKNALALIGAQSENFVTEEGMVNELMLKSQTAGGQLQALQAGNQISVAMVGQMQQLRQLQMAQTRAQSDYIAGEQSIKDQRKEGYDKVFGRLDKSRVKR